MFRHQGKNRTLKHNLQIATILSFVAGIVNVTGFLAFKQLTTNVTGHFALFINDFAHLKLWRGAVYFIYILSFFAGSFLSGLLIELFKKNQQLNVFVIPTAIEVSLLGGLGFLGFNFFEINTHLVVCLLLFAMGIQNAFVTKISDAVVRTTHLTGLITDLGIELSQLLFPKQHPNTLKLKANIKLRFYIIMYFFIGGFVGGFLFSELQWQLKTLLLAAVILLASLLYDDLRYQILLKKRKLRKKVTA